MKLITFDFIFFNAPIYLKIMITSMNLNTTLKYLLDTKPDEKQKCKPLQSIFYLETSKLNFFTLIGQKLKIQKLLKYTPYF